MKDEFDNDTAVPIDCTYCDTLLKPKSVAEVEAEEADVEEADAAAVTTSEVSEDVPQTSDLLESSGAYASNETDSIAAIATADDDILKEREEVITFPATTTADSNEDSSDKLTQEVIVNVKHESETETARETENEFDESGQTAMQTQKPVIDVETDSTQEQEQEQSEMTSPEVAGARFMTVDLSSPRSWASWRELVVSLYAEFEENKAALNQMREDSGLLSKQEDSSGTRGGEVLGAAATRRKSKAEMKAEKDAQKDREKRERSLKKKEARRLKLVHASDDNDDEDGVADGDGTNGSSTSKREKPPKSAQKKLHFRIADIEKCATAIEVIAVSELGQPTWKMKPTSFSYDESSFEDDVPDMELPDIHNLRNVPVRLCLGIPIEKSAKKDKEKAARKRADSKLTTEMSGLGESRARANTVSSVASSNDDAGGDDVALHSVLSRFEERIGIVGPDGPQVFKAPNASIPYDCWTV